MSQFPTPSPRAKAIVAGLMRTGRAKKCHTAAKFIRADGAGETYWVSADGTRVLRGELIKGADELQPGFLNAMARAGA